MWLTWWYLVQLNKLFFPFGYLNPGRECPFLQVWQALELVRSGTTVGIACLTHAVALAWMANCQSLPSSQNWQPYKVLTIKLKLFRETQDLCLVSIRLGLTQAPRQPLCMGSFLRHELWWWAFIQTLGAWSEIALQGASISILWAKSWPATMFLWFLQPLQLQRIMLMQRLQIFLFFL